MIIWISGAYGVGKSTVADVLKKKMNNAMIYDAEAMGNAVRDNYPSWHNGAIFEDYPLWAEFNYKLLKDIAKRFDGTILVPMTLLRQTSYDAIIGRLLADGIETRLFILDASEQSLHDRILARGEAEDCWCMQNREMARSCAAAIQGGTVIPTDGKCAAEIVTAIEAHSAHIIVDQEISLIPYYPCYEESFQWYQDLDVCKQVDNIDHVYSMELLRRMYTYLNTHGDCYYIQFQGKLVGDVALRDDNEVCIVVCKEYQNKHIGRRCIQSIIDLARNKGIDEIKANIYSFNTQSRKMFASIGFVQTEEEWFSYRIAKSLLETTLNTRDLGGYSSKTANINLRSWQILRSDVQNYPSDRDIALLISHSISTIIDMRSEKEVQRKPSGFANREGFTYHHIPIEEGSGIPATVDDVSKSYMNIAQSKNIARVFKTIAAAPGGVMYNCTAGKDRTGVVSAVLLGLCGTPDESIVSDYMLTKTCSRQRFEQIHLNFPEIDMNIVIPQKRYMQEFIEMLKAKYGSYHAYLTAVSLDEYEIEQIREKLM